MKNHRKISVVFIFIVFNKEQEVQVSDTTKDEKEKKAGN